MTCLQKSVKFFQRKFFLLCFLFILLVLLFGLLIFWVSPPLKKSVDMERRRQRYGTLCERRSCIYGWISKYQSDANLTEMNQTCTAYKYHPFINNTFEAYQEKLVDWRVLQAIYHYYWYHYCHRKCGLDGPIHYYLSYRASNQQMVKAWKQYALCKIPYKTNDSCRWRAYSLIFKFYFSFFSIPTTILLNYINLTILLQLLGKGAGAALYLHAAEIVTDGILNLFTSLHLCLYIFSSFKGWRSSCGYSQHTSLFQSMFVVKQWLSFLNQTYLMGLLADRLYALTKPIQYKNISDSDRKKQAKSVILKVLLGTCVLHLPLLIFRTFRPTVLHWESISSFWKAYHQPIDISLSIFYVIISFGLLISQIICGAFVVKKYRKFINKQLELDQESEDEVKRKERDKQLLLIGTIGLNVITGITSAMFNMVINVAFMKFLGYTVNRPWWALLISMLDVVLTFINGNAALIIHIIFVKSYRSAFKATWFGRIIF